MVQRVDARRVVGVAVGDDVEGPLALMIRVGSARVVGFVFDGLLWLAVIGVILFVICVTFAITYKRWFMRDE